MEAALGLALLVAIALGVFLVVPALVAVPVLVVAWARRPRPVGALTPELDRPQPRPGTQPPAEKPAQRQDVVRAA
ncbi:hypothetical protein [Luteococcus sanguinis]|uniref:Uncharacterized protein n=1 Tax=Luteococcus sanguinis TaxID=174038 RepID=A0ABW1X227_9ACTN